jgi:transmembrane sensor
MNNVQVFSSKQDIQQQACEWISRFDRGLSEAEKLAFADWVNISQTHRQYLFEFAQTWDELSVLNELNTLFPLRDSHHRQTNTFSKRTNVGIAASLAFVLISCFAWLVNIQYMSSMEEPSLLVREAETNVGEHRELSLADGSVIHLNTDSQVSIDFSDTHRDIHLIRGEAHFEVAHDEQRPFIVTAGDNTVTAIGTAFNVQITNPNELELLVTEGKVLVKNQQENNSIPSIAESVHPLDGIGELMVA